ncbi:MAG: pseudouridine synthase [Verrucomicrobium sp.]|nr:pseudouridine synthase [Verrucomicrobium sp.]
MRLNRFLAQAGCGSRRACEQLITEGRVTINGKVVTDLSTQVEAGDHVKAGKRLLRNERLMTAMLHKPRGFLCTADDPEGRKTIFQLLPSNWPRVFYVGRLDADSEGLLLVTNDGALSQRLTHPSYKLPKTYEVVLDKEFDFTLAEKLKKGLFVEGQKGRFESIHRLGATVVKVVLTQGIKRQIRQMFELVGYKVKRLIRTEIGKLKLGDLPAGQWRLLSDEEIRRSFGSAKPQPAPPSAAKKYKQSKSRSAYPRRSPSGERKPTAARAARERRR